MVWLDLMIKKDDCVVCLASVTSSVTEKVSADVQIIQLRTRKSSDSGK